MSPTVTAVVAAAVRMGIALGDKDTCYDVLL